MLHITPFSILFLFLGAFAEPLRPIPWALTFGPSTIIASRWNLSGTIEQWNLSLSDSYRNYMTLLVSNHEQRFQKYGHMGQFPLCKLHKHRKYTPSRPPQNVLATSMFEAVFEQGKKELSTKVDDGDSIVYGALFFSTLFDDSHRDAATRVAFPRGRMTKRDGFKIVRYAPHAAAYAYGLDRCELYMTTKECAAAYPMPDKFILAIEYEQAFIHLHILSTFPEDHVFMPEWERINWTLGESANVDIKPQSLGPEAYRQELKGFIDEFMTEAAREYRSRIVAIVSMGEASAAVISEFEEIARGVVGNGVAKVYNSIDPALTASHGAALYARESVLNPYYEEQLDEEVLGHEEL